jgi:Tfp pilus assembly protein PilF
MRGVDFIMRRKLNLLALGVLTALAAVTAVSVHLCHDWQVSRHANLFLTLADKAADDPKLAREHLERYLQMAPHDSAARCRYALLLDAHATTPKAQLQAFFALERAVRELPERAEVRRALARCAFALQRHSDAQFHWEHLRADEPRDGEALEGLADCARVAGKPAAAHDLYQQAQVAAPERVNAFIADAQLLRAQLKQPDEADRTVRRLVERNPQSVPAHSAAGRYWLKHQQLDAAAQVLLTAHTELQSDAADVLLLLAELERTRGKLDQARTYLTRCLAQHPQHSPALHALARLELLTHHPEAATRLARQAAEQRPAGVAATWAAADLLLDVGATSEAQGLVDTLAKEGGLPAGWVEYLHGRVAVQQQQWSAARGWLETARPQLTAAPELQKLACHLLAVCHEHLGNPDGRLAALRGAAAFDPSAVPMRLHQATALIELGRFAEAGVIYEQLLPQVPAVRLSWARLLVQQQGRLPSGRRNLTKVQQLLADTPENLRTTSEYHLLQAELLLLSDRVAEARTYLTTASAALPQSLELIAAQAALAVRAGERAVAERLLTTATEQLGERVELRLAKATLFAHPPGPASVQLLDELANDRARFTPDEQAKLLRGLAAIASASDAAALARKFLLALVELKPSDLPARFALFGLAIQLQDEPTAKACVAQLKEIEGNDGARWRCAEVQFALRFRADNSVLLDSVRKLAGEAQQRQPSWPTAYRLGGELADRLHDYDGAVGQYQKAIQLGDTTPSVVRRTVQLLHQRRRFREAQELLTQVAAGGPLTGLLGQLATETALHTKGANADTLSQARAAVGATNANYHDHLWLAQVLFTHGRTDEAEAEFKTALRLAPEAVESHLSLVLFYQRTNRADAAKQAFARAQTQIAANDLPLARALGLEALGDVAAAEQAYLQATKSRAIDAAIVQNVACFYLRTQRTAQALPFLRQLVGVSRDPLEQAWARRNVALCLAQTNQPEYLREALGCLSENLGNHPNSIEDRRARAFILATRPAHRREAIAAFEDLFQQVPAAAEEQFTLAQLVDAEGDTTKARGLLLDLVTAHDRNPQYIAYYLTSLIRAERFDEAHAWLPKLTALDAKSWTTTQIVARLAVGRKQPAEALAVVTRFEQALPADASRLPVALLLDDLELFNAAETIYRREKERSTAPDRALPLARHLGRRGQTATALSECLLADSKAAPELIASVALGIVRHQQATGADRQRVQQWLSSALTQHSQSLGLLVAQAELYELEGKIEQVIPLYRQILARDSVNAIAGNNLAVILALRGQTKEALPLIERVLHKYGPVPSLLDTRALVHLAMGQTDTAITDLTEAIRQEASAVRYYHLAQAQTAAKNAIGAASAWKKARTLGLTERDLHPLELAGFRAFSAEQSGPTG